MPLYEYACQSCEEFFTLLQPVSIQPNETTCPRCGERKAKRLFSTFASKTSGEPAPVPSAGGHNHCGPCGCA